MDNDLYVDCPSCGHTVKVANDLIGAMVECPDCSFNFEVPDIREGLNPRFRAKVDAVPGADYDFPDLGELHAGLQSVLRRQRAQAEQMGFLHENTELLLKQLTKFTPFRLPDTREGNLLQTVTAQANPAWLRWSLIFGCISIAAALMVTARFVASNGSP